MFHVVLFRPEIPPNTGNVMRLCANTGNTLHLVHPLGFTLDDARLRRAGMDYRDRAVVREHVSLEAFLGDVAPSRLVAFTRRHGDCYADFAFSPGDALLFGPESVGLPDEVLSSPQLTAVLRIPMRPQSRSLNLSNAAAVVVYEAWRQQGFRLEAPERGGS